MKSVNYCPYCGDGALFSHRNDTYECFDCKEKFRIVPMNVKIPYVYYCPSCGHLNIDERKDLKEFTCEECKYTFTPVHRKL